MASFLLAVAFVLNKNLLLGRHYNDHRFTKYFAHLLHLMPGRVVSRAGLGLKFFKTFRADFGPAYKPFL